MTPSYDETGMLCHNEAPVLVYITATSYFQAAESDTGQTGDKSDFKSHNVHNNNKRTFRNVKNFTFLSFFLSLVARVH